METKYHVVFEKKPSGKVDIRCPKCKQIIATCPSERAAYFNAPLITEHQCPSASEPPRN